MEGELLCESGDGEKATHTCPSGDAPAVLCKACFDRFIETHYRIPDRFSQPSLACSVCKVRVAEKFCYCTGLPAVCVGCINAHICKSGSLIHYFFPVDKKPRLDTESSIAQVRNKVKYLDDAKGKLLRNLNEVKKCKELIEVKYQQLEAQLLEVKDRRIGELDDLRNLMQREFDSAFQEAEGNLLSLNYRPNGGVRMLLSQHHSLEDEDFLCLFKFELRENEPDLENLVAWESRLKNDGTVVEDFYRVCPKLVAVIHPQNICFFIPSPENEIGWSLPLSQPIPNADFASYVFLNDGTVFVTGFYSGAVNLGLQDAYSINKSTGEVKVLEILPQPKFSMGLSSFREFVYSFGGFHQAISLKTCEKYSLVDGDWHQMHDMLHTRHYFNACLHQGLIYLCGGSAIETEVFTPGTDVFSPLGIRLSEPSNAATFVQSDELVVITAKQVTRWNFRTKVVRVSGNQAGPIGPRSQPVLVDKTLYLVNTQPLGGCDGVRRLDLKTMKFKGDIVRFYFKE